uniref:uncharacterized protein LOC120336875 n=1 Tax=Styela clava TaxID=7725 RepID=UPI0019394DE4|nr:uncharacterized protein LOC120336875 [Styela clava]
MKITPVVLLCCCIIAKALQFEEFDYKKDFDKNLEKEYLPNFLDEKSIEAEIDTQFDDDEDFEPDLERNFEAIFEDAFEHDYEKDLTEQNLAFCREFKLCKRDGDGFKIGCAGFKNNYKHRKTSFPGVWKNRAGTFCVNCQEKCGGTRGSSKLG